ncbi:sensor histidine kinase [Proteiniclasticum sp.]|uniref:sensor histidine kinase n=1 Tax=Proteiniclasticum sp. TaxID=2053595 RepID=UPI0025F26F9C|nr:sensor histidine kinase [Proteiniclasticum sp.]
MKLKWKFTLLFTLILTGTFVLSAVFTSYRSYESSRKTTDELSLQLMASKASEVSGWLSQRIRELHTISRTPTVTAMEETALKEYVTKLSSDMDAYYGNEYGTFGINDFSGLEYITENQTIDVRDRSYFKEMLITDKPYLFSAPVSSKTDGTPITVLCYGISDEDGSKKGFVAASISLKKLTEITGNLSIYEGKTMIMDRRGMMYTMGAESYPKEILLKIRESIPSDSPFPVIQKAIDENHHVFYAEIPSSPGWYLCTLVENEKLYQEASALSLSLSKVFVTMFGAGILGAFFISSQITRRITNLSVAMDHVQEGNFNTRLSVQGNDEIAELSHHFNSMLKDLRRLMNEVVETQKEKRKRELEILQAQINPHFIYNTLDTLQWKALEYGASDLSELILSLSSFFRVSLSKGKEMIPLREEIKHVRSYLDIQKARYEEILTYEIQVEESLDDVFLPKILLQPLVENAIYHGIKPKLAQGKISILAQLEGEDLLLTVQDNGVGMTEELVNQLEEAFEGKRAPVSYGLHNVHQRIRLTYGTPYGLHVESCLQDGTAVTIRLPMEKKEEMYDV